MDESEERIDSHGVVEGAGISHRTFNPGFAGSTPVDATKSRKTIDIIERMDWYARSRRPDYCPALGGHVHSYVNMIYWGHASPHCNACGYDDVTRLVE